MSRLLLAVTALAPSESSAVQQAVQEDGDCAELTEDAPAISQLLHRSPCLAYAAGLCYSTLEGTSRCMGVVIRGDSDDDAAPDPVGAELRLSDRGIQACQWSQD